MKKETGSGEDAPKGWTYKQGRKIAKVSYDIGFQEGKTQALKDVDRIIDEMDKNWNWKWSSDHRIGVEELKERITEIKKQLGEK